MQVGRIYFFCTLIIAVLILGCYTSFNYHVSDITKSEQFEINVSDFPSTLEVKCVGQINGDNATLYIKGVNPSHSEFIELKEGKIDTSFRIDWYSNENIITYIPNSISSGTLKILIKLG